MSAGPYQRTEQRITSHFRVGHVGLVKDFHRGRIQNWCVAVLLAGVVFVLVFLRYATGIAQSRHDIMRTCQFWLVFVCHPRMRDCSNEISSGGVSGDEEALGGIGVEGCCVLRGPDGGVDAVVCCRGELMFGCEAIVDVDAYHAEFGCHLEEEGGKMSEITDGPAASMVGDDEWTLSCRWLIARSIDANADCGSVSNGNLAVFLDHTFVGECWWFGHTGTELRDGFALEVAYLRFLPAKVGFDTL